MESMPQMSGTESGSITASRSTYSRRPSGVTVVRIQRLYESCTSSGVRPALDLTDAQHLAGAHRDGLAGDRLDDQLLAHRAVGRRVHLDEARWTRSERSPSGEQKANMLDNSSLEDISAALAEHTRFNDPIDQCQMVGIDGEFHLDL